MQGISFDDIPTSNSLLSNYAGFQWSNIAILNATMLHNGYSVSASSTNQIAYNTNLSPIYMVRVNQTFSIYSLRISGIWSQRSNLTLTGSYMGMVQHTHSQEINRTFIWTLKMNWSNIDTFNIIASPTPAPPHLAIDNICVRV
jgi:hypothetical protein